MGCLTFLLVVIYICHSIWPAHSGRTGVILYREHIWHPRGTYFQETLQIPQSNRISVKYNISFKAEKCCPIINFDFVPLSSQKTFLVGCSTLRYDYAALYSLYYIYTKNRFPHSGCSIVSDHYICNGSRNLVTSSPRTWVFRAGYECVNNQNLNINVDMELQYFTDHQSRCEPLINTDCKTILNYNYTTFPNVIGQTSQREANNLYAVAMSLLTQAFNCYQHIKLFGCRILFPKCHNGKMIPPCREMCLEAATGCKEVRLRFNHFIGCGGLDNLDGPNECFYEPVMCPELQPPEFGSVVTTGQTLFSISLYTCNTSYELAGNARRHCMHSGLWNGTAPLCRSLSKVEIAPTDDSQHEILSTVLPVTILLLVTIIIAGFLVYHREAMKLLFLHNAFIDGQIPQDRPQRKLFVTYSTEDMGGVNQGFLPDLRRQLPRWEVLTYQQDFVAGESLLGNIHKGVWESQAMLVLLTDNYIASRWCKYEFTEAETRAVVDKTFQLIVIRFERNDQEGQLRLGGLPENLRDFVDKRVHLFLGENLFWNKLRQSLAKQE